tara:strand:- start:1829 stop:2485 length:657 start_codon:yes stop_codon:yes gene_type:complete
MKKNNISVWEAENVFYQKTNISRVGKLIYQYEIYKLIKDLPGDILEFGVFKGNSLIRFLTFRSIIENNYSRKIYGFDTFKDFPEQKRKNDKKLKRDFTSDAGKPKSKQSLDKILQDKKFDNFELVEGNVLKTLNKFITKNPNLRISLLHLDMDVFNATNFVLNKLKDKVVKNGIILVDDYGTVEGATKVVDNFLKKNKKLELKKMSFYKVPSFIIKRF